MSVTAVGNQKRDEGAHTSGVGSIDNRSSLAGAPHQARTRQDGNVGGKSVVRTADGVRDSTG